MIAAIPAALLSGGKAAFGFVRALPWQVHVAIMALVLLWIGHGIHERKVAAAEKAAYTKGVDVTKAAFWVAQAKADAAQLAKVRRLAAVADKISKEITHAFDAKNDSIDARAAQLRLRHDAAARDRAARPGNLPAPGAVAARTCPPAEADGLPWGPALGLMTEAAKNLAQLNAILDWEKRQSELAAEPAR